MIKETIKKIRNEILVRRNSRWAHKHDKELNEKYNGKMILIIDCKVVAVGTWLSDMPHSDAPGALYYETRIADPYKYFGFKKEDFYIIKEEK